MKKKIIAPAALNALKEALTQIYWYKRDLRTFLFNCINDKKLLAQINWDDYKVVIVNNIVDYMSLNQDKYQNDLINLMIETARIRDFSHLEHLDDSAEKIRRAKKAVETLRRYIQEHEAIIGEKELIQKKREEAQLKIERTRKLSANLEKLKNKYFKLLVTDDKQKRGYQLEALMKDLFELFDLDPKASFRNTGEQIDGAFTFDNTDYLFEAKWTQNPCGISELDTFNGKVKRNLDNTLGLFLSINGFSNDAVNRFSGSRSVLILMDGEELVHVLEGRIAFDELLFLKRRHAAQTGNIYYKVFDT